MKLDLDIVDINLIRDALGKQIKHHQQLADRKARTSRVNHAWEARLRRSILEKIDDQTRKEAE